ADAKIVLWIGALHHAAAAKRTVVAGWGRLHDFVRTPFSSQSRRVQAKSRCPHGARDFAVSGGRDPSRLILAKQLGRRPVKIRKAPAGSSGPGLRQPTKAAVRIIYSHAAKKASAGKWVIT